MLQIYLFALKGSKFTILPANNNNLPDVPLNYCLS